MGSYLSSGVNAYGLFGVCFDHTANNRLLHNPVGKNIHLTAVVPEELAGKRLDQALARLFSGHSRSRLQEWIRSGDVLVDNRAMRQRERVRGGEQIEIRAAFSVQEESLPEDIPLEVIHEDPSLLVVNKPPGLVVHPGAGNPHRTLLNALLHYDSTLDRVPRAGIVHRLDKNTSGLMVIARTPECHTRLVEMMQSRKIERQYQAIVTGAMTAGGTVDAPVGRHPVKRTRMAVVERGKPAVTHYRVIRRFAAYTHIRIQLETGRTHQIRVHMAHIRHPIVGDPVYGGRLRLPKNASGKLITALKNFPRQALHASDITLPHPATGERLQCHSHLPEDMQQLLQILENENNAGR